MNPVCVVGSGGREFTLVEKLSKETSTYVIPGNDGIQRSLSVPIFRLPEHIELDSQEAFNRVSNVAEYIQHREKALIVIGPERPLATGMVNHLKRDGHLVFGPTQEASIVESSKCWSSEFMERNGIPTPSFYNPTTYQDAMDYVKKRGVPLVIKGDELAQGKGVTVARTFAVAQSDLHSKMVERRLGGPRVNIQDYVDIAYELSAMAIADVRKRNGHFTGDYRLLLYSMDHKPLFDDDEGPNTGGMGAVAPLPLPEEMKKRIRSDVIEPTIEGLIKEGIEFTGCLYPALAVDKKGNLYVLEYNVRFGDPETQVVLDLMNSSLYDYLMATTVGELHTMPEIRWRDGYSVIVNLGSPGYPDSPQLGFSIIGLSQNGQLEGDSNITVVHAGTKFEKDTWITNGGRILGIRGRGSSLQSTIDAVYANVKRVYSQGGRYRSDIGRKAMLLT